MKAVKLYEPGNIKVENVDKPSISEDGVLVKVKAVGICGSDIPRVLEKGAYYEGITIGHEFAGKVVECGSKVENWKEGDRVTVAPLIPCRVCEYCEMGHFSLCEDYSYYGSRTEGAIADYISVDPRNLLKLPDNVTYKEGAMVDPAANAVHGLWKGNIEENDTVAIIGLGAIGLFAVQFAKLMGASKVIAVDIHDDKLDLAKALSADMVINSSKIKLEEALKDEVVDVVLDTSGSPIAQNSAVLIAGKLARVVFLGISNQELDLEPKAVDRLLRHEISVIGSWNSFSTPFPGEEWTYSIDCMAKDLLQAEPIISHEFNLEDTPQVFEDIKEKKLLFNKIMILPKGE